MKPNIYDDLPVPSGGSHIVLKAPVRSSKSQSRRKESRKGSPATTAANAHVRLTNFTKGTQVTEKFHSKLKTAKTACVPNSSTKPTTCLSSVMRPPIPGYLMAETDKRSKDIIMSEATDFLEQYYESILKSGTTEYEARLFEVCDSICLTGTYELTLEELVYGIKTAWRNAPRCIGRIQWKNLEVFDCRNVETARDMFEAICRHLKFASNGGNIRSAITVFRQRLPQQQDFRVWNSQLIRYAGYLQSDGSVIGDPANVEFTQICEGLGWVGKGGMFDVVPLVLQANGGKPEWFTIPQELILEVSISHPKYDWFADLGLKWYGVPCVSDMQLDVGGLQFPAAPFNGWYMGTEVGARNLCDTYRYNKLESIAKGMGLDTSSTISLWKDLALIEANVAVLHSYNEAKVTITDHHSASESFMQHMEKEQRARGGCPADWVWIVPPVSGSICPVFHQEMLSYQLKPAFLYQSEAWKSYSFGKKRKPLTTVKIVATAVRFLTRIMRSLNENRPSLTILYATETGKAERFALRVRDVFNTGFKIQVSCMADYDTSRLSSESFLLVITSTFGNGEPPTNGETFNRNLKKLAKECKNGGNKNNDNDSGCFRYSVFGLGSSAYPDFCAFACNVDLMLQEIGGKRLAELHKGDELGGQEEAFQAWARSVFTSACDTFPVHHGVNKKAILSKLGTDTSEVFKSYRLIPVTRDSNPEPLKELEKIHDKNIFPCKIMARKNLQSLSSSRATILVQLDTQGSADLSYDPGDHVAIFPTNDRKLVQSIVGRITTEHPLETVLKLEMRQDNQDWKQVKRLPPCSILEALSKYLDITTPPTPDFLRMLASYAKAPKEREQILTMGKGGPDYKSWITESHPHLADVLDQFPSLQVPAWFLLDHLPVLTPRYYSISSCPRVHPKEIHITVAVVKYHTTGNNKSFHKGVCSSWLENLSLGETIPAYIKKAPSFHLPSDNSKPILLVGNGTGIAPFRSFWQRRKLQMALTSHKHMKMALVFGCRHPDIDDIYRDETSVAQSMGAITEVLTGYSRVPGKAKKYVQDVLQDNPDLICKYLLEEEGHIYVCGDNIMAVDVRKTLEHILGSKGKMTKEEAKDYVNNMRESGRYHEDLFGVVTRLPEVKTQDIRPKRKLSFTAVVDLIKSYLPH